METTQIRKHCRLRSNRVCFTLNNYTLEDLGEVENLENVKSDIKYFVCGIEIGEKGTPHLQGFIHIDKDPKSCGIKYWKNYFQFGNRAHFESARGTDEQSKEYCTKDGPYIEIGLPSLPGDKFREIYETAKEDLEKAVALDYEFGMKHYNNLRAIHEAAGNKTFEEMNDELFDWQKNALEALESQNNRNILFVVDYKGNKGKSYLAKWILMNKNAWACQG